MTTHAFPPPGVLIHLAIETVSKLNALILPKLQLGDPSPVKYATVSNGF